MGFFGKLTRVVTDVVALPIETSIDLISSGTTMLHTENGKTLTQNRASKLSDDWDDLVDELDD